MIIHLARARALGYRDPVVEDEESKSETACCPSCEHWEAAGRPTFTAGTTPASAITPAEAIVVFTHRGARWWLRPTGDQVVFGRGPTCDVVSDDPMWSRRQSRLHFASDTVYVGDLDSACGTFIDGAQIGVDTALPEGSCMSFARVEVWVVREVPPDARPYRKNLWL